MKREYLQNQYGLHERCLLFDGFHIGR